MPPVQTHPIHRRSKDALVFQPHTLGVVVRENGDIPPADTPRKFILGHDEIVTWIVGNASGQPIKVSLLTFLRRDHPGDETGNPNNVVSPFLWLGTNAVKLLPDQTGIIAGRRDPSYQTHGLGDDSVSYTIRVEGPFGVIDYDPDGEIKP